MKRETITNWIKNVGRFAIALAAVAMTAKAAAQTSQLETNRATIAKAMDACAAGTDGPYDLLAEDAVWTISGSSLASKNYPSKEAFMSEDTAVQRADDRAADHERACALCRL